MRRKSFLFVANWKMGFTGEQAIRYVREHIAEMMALASRTGNYIVLCPPFPLIQEVQKLTSSQRIQLGGQTCSSFALGAYTGEVSAYLLAELGCQYCIVGHSERRRYCYETDDDIARKIRLCMLAGMSPIICIGETNENTELRTTEVILDGQLSLLYDYLVDLEFVQAKPLWIAYEPVWAIGTGKVADPVYLQKVYESLGRIAERRVPRGCPVRFMYGGSLTGENIENIVHIDLIDGFMVGGASLDFQKFKNMISLGV